MTEHKTFPGKTYCVTSAEGCTVTDSTGALSMECEAGKQLHVTAPSDKLFTSASAIVREVFNLAPAKLKALGLLGGGELYPGFDLKKYALCTSYNDMVAVRSDFWNDVTDKGVWPYPLPEVTSMGSTTDWWSGWFSKSPIVKMVLTLPKCTYTGVLFSGQTTRKLKHLDLKLPLSTNVYALVRNCTNLEYCRIYAPKATEANNFALSCTKVKYIDVNMPSVTSMYDAFGGLPVTEIKGAFGEKAINAEGAFSNCKNLKLFPVLYPKLQKGTNMFNNCQLPKDAAIAVLNSLPAYTSGTHAITMGIHKDHENDAEVLAAIENAEAKGWTVSRQWNGTATAQAASTWRLRRPCIYAKVREVEQPDGVTIKELDWGHYVTNAEENGYRAFSSVEEAEEELLTEQ